MNAIVTKSDHRYTVAEYLTWTEEERWELINGVAYNMSPAPAIKHQIIAGEIFVRLKEKLRGKPCQAFIAPVDVVLSDRDVVQPDIIVICDPIKITEKNIQGAPDLVVEVLSPGTATKDLREKKALYERTGVREYVLVDPLEDYVQAFRLNTNGQYGSASIYGPRETLAFDSLAGLTIDLWALFGYPAPDADTPSEAPPA